MSRNESPLDRGLRGALGAVLAVIGIAVGASTIAGVGLLAIAAVLIVTAAVGFCPLYRLLGMSTLPTGRTEATSPTR